jgi:hypothetical protein
MYVVLPKVFLFSGKIQLYLHKLKQTITIIYYKIYVMAIAGKKSKIQAHNSLARTEFNYVL